MKFYINTENGSGQKFSSKEAFLKEMSLMIDDCITNGGTVFEISVAADASCFYNDENDSYVVNLYGSCAYMDKVICKKAFNNLHKALVFARESLFDEVVNDVTGEVVWRREER